MTQLAHRIYPYTSKLLLMSCAVLALTATYRVALRRRLPTNASYRRKKVKNTADRFPTVTLLRDFTYLEPPWDPVDKDVLKVSYHGRTKFYVRGKPRHGKQEQAVYDRFDEEGFYPKSVFDGDRIFYDDRSSSWLLTAFNCDGDERTLFTNVADYKNGLNHQIEDVPVANWQPTRFADLICPSLISYANGDSPDPPTAPADPPTAPADPPTAPADKPNDSEHHHTS